MTRIIIQIDNAPGVSSNAMSNFGIHITQVSDLLLSISLLEACNKCASSCLLQSTNQNMLLMCSIPVFWTVGYMSLDQPQEIAPACLSGGVADCCNFGIP